jgi:MoaA/NifB/PqqE/SkfB family radical SAM enzyme
MSTMNTLTQAIRVLKTRLGMTRPIYAHYGVTHRCNMRCRMCEVWKTARRDMELDVRGVERLAENLRQAGVLAVALGGGEPFVRDDLPERVHAFARRGFDVRLLTNGIGVSDEALRGVVDAGLAHVSISLDSLDPARQKDIYGGVDVWHEIVDTMHRFRALLPRDSIPVINVVVSRANLEELLSLVTFAESVGFFCSFIPISLSPSQGESDGFNAVAPELAIGPEEEHLLRRVYRDLLRKKRRGAPIANSSRFLEDSMDHLISSACPWTCDAGRLYLSIGPEGDISACHSLKPFARYDAAELEATLKNLQREFARQRAACEGCMRPCWAEVTHATWSAPAAIEAYRTILAARRIKGRLT